jgi:8-oxo-dGTP pyrophosphatase MutT (NUDIX family)
MTTIRIKGAGVILRDSADRILLVLGRKHNKWSFPKGHVDETDASGEGCAIRECKEETGLVVDIPHDVPYWMCNKYIYYTIGPDNVTCGWRLNPEDRNEVVRASWMTEEQVSNLSNANMPVRKFMKKLQHKSG